MAPLKTGAIMIKLCHIDELKEGQSLGFTLDDRHIFAVKKYEKIHVYENACPHLGIQLEMIPHQFLDSTHSLIQCSMHGALFRIEDGLCISGPCLEQHLKALEFKIENEQLYLR